jgi:hypothetical protein
VRRCDLQSMVRVPGPGIRSRVNAPAPQLEVVRQKFFYDGGDLY